MAVIFLLPVTIWAQSPRQAISEKLNASIKLIKENPNEAIRLGQEAHDMAKEYQDGWSKAITMSGMGYISYKIRDYEAAFLNYSSALELLESADTVDYYNQTTVLHHLAMIHSKFNNYDQSIEFRKQALKSARLHIDNYPESAEKLNQKKHLINQPYFMALEYQKKGAYHTAGEILVDLWNRAEDKEDIQTYAKVLNTLGLIKKRNGEFGSAQEYLGLVVSGDEVPDKVKAYAYHNLAGTYMEQGELERAESYFLIALDLKKEIDNERSLFITYLDMGELAYKRNDMAGAIQLWETGLSVFDKVDGEPELYNVYNWLQLAYMDIDIEKAKSFNQEYAKLNNFYVRNQTFQREEESSRREALSALIDQEKQRRLDAQQRQQFIKTFWPVFLGVGLLVLFSIILGVRYYVALRANRALSQTQLKLERAKEILRSADTDLD